MHLALDTGGAWLVDPDELAGRLGIATSHLLSQMRRGLLTSRIEPGRDEDEGRYRVTVQAENAGWEGIFDGSGALLSECALCAR
ncbi:DUF6522 family protein [Methylobacterium gnaphalii]|uniref:Uncharacterized protein n=2 Tax=Methylobacterium gnaphalii TaxID=1010610 RepID=A0A512JS85_9HYPH|nr:DUF6522 family protein [Methylobacterium gnaphalii]GEP12753.1 hypothetical protein MGN01_45980 [Methylobacterium gnaphalii]GJD70508.1 hypothetical protein MMMDOFMJ_3457 [Methylobacterium gnaphalii]GLS49147.1 hypothetical protein GCM10007885_19950 [Methylobacterium gnaphalii]